MSALAVFIEAVLSCDLYGAFVSLCAAVSEEYPAVSGDIAELIGEFSLYSRVVVVGIVLERSDLSTNGISPFLVAVAEAVGTYTASEVDIFLAVLVFTASAASLFHNERISAVRLHNVFIEFLYSFFTAHSQSPSVTR